MLDIIVNAGQTTAHLPWLASVFALARRHQAFLTGVQLMLLCPPLVDESHDEAVRADRERGARARRDWWLELCRDGHVSGEWEVLCGTQAEVLAKRSRLVDFVIGELRVSDADELAGFDETTHALFSNAAPVLLVPDIWQGDLRAARVLIAWNGSGEAAHAVKAALPLLKQANAVHVLDGERSGIRGISPAPPPLREWLERHDIKAQWAPFPAEHEVGPALLDAARALGADLLVMGAWGRPRMSELVLGGTTRWLLDHASLPLFLAR